MLRLPRALAIAAGLSCLVNGAGGCGAEAPPASSGSASKTLKSEAPTFADDIAPLVHRECAVCHHEGGSGPFSLLSYDDLSDHAEQIVEVTQTGYMPPWLPLEGYGEFEGQRHLGAADRQLLADWVAAGRPPGELAAAPKPPTFNPGWQLGEPDLELKVEAAYELPADGQDVYRNFVIRVPEGPTRLVKTVELRPGPAQVVHHAVMRVDLEGDARRLEQADPEPGFDGMVLSGARMPGGRFIGWTPGRTPWPGTDDRAWQLLGGTDLVVQVHLRPTGKPELVAPRVGIHFAEQPPTKAALSMVLSSTNIDIAPGEREFRVVDHFELPADVWVLSIYPHAHYIGKQLQAYATLPDQTRQWLIRIDDWDFNWQDEYRYAEPLRLPKGSVITMDHVYDNSADNPRNPSAPPKRVTFGPNSTDEMAELILEIEPVNPQDMSVLDRASLRKWLAVQIDTVRRTLDDDPEHAEAWANLGALQAHAEQPTEAMASYETSLEIRDDAATRVDLAIVMFGLELHERAQVQLDAALKLEPDQPRAHLVLANRAREAENYRAAAASYARAIAGDPTLVEAHNNLGVTHEKLGDPAKAVEAFAEAARLSPGKSRYRENLGRALQAAGDYDGALQAYREALERNAGSIKAMHGAAWVLATHPDPARRDPAQALRFADAGVRATQGRSPELLESLAAALAASGRFDKALEVIAGAIELSRAAGREDFVRRFEGHRVRLAAGELLVAG